MHIQLYMLSHYITSWNVSSNCNNYLTSEWGKFKLAKQHDSIMRSHKDS